MASLVVATLVLSLATVALTTDDAQAGWNKKRTPNGQPGTDANGADSNTGNGGNGGIGGDGTSGGDLTCEKTGCH
jgi:hypothetical protein